AALDTPDGELRRELDALLDAHASPGLLDENVLDLVSVPPYPATAPAPIGSALAGTHYVLHEPVGGGGMGVVFKAWDRRLGRTVALKFLPSHLVDDAAARERLRVEAQ